MESTNNVAPLASLATVAPSLDSSPLLTPRKDDISLEIQPSEKVEVKFDTTPTASSSSSSSCEDDGDKPHIPDGGWGWVVVLASVILSMIMDGISFSFGILFPELVTEFKASKSDTSWIGSLFMAVPLLSGPIMSAFVDKYGCRPMTIVGGLISAAGFIISSRVNSLVFMYLTFGILSGLGLGLCYVTAVVSVAFWFDKRRTLAVGLAASGTGIGTFAFAPLTDMLLEEYGWRYTTLILGGIFLNCCVCGMLLRDPEWITQQNK